MGASQIQITQMESDGHGIKELLEAEKRRQEKMRAAKSDAEKEIADYKAQREAEFQAYKNKHSTGGSESSEQLAAQTTAAVADLEREAAKNKQKVVDMLVGYVTNVVKAS